MAVLKERRAFPRFKIPNAKITFLQEEGFQGAGSVSGEGVLDDCSLRGIRFITKIKLQPGAKIKLELSVPSQEPIKLDGNIIWCSSLSYKNRTIAVVELAPFGEGKGYNSIEALNDLEKIADEYLHQFD